MGGALGGGSQTTSQAPSQLDIQNARIASLLAPVMVRNSVPGLMGINSSEGAGGLMQQIAKGNSGGAQPGTAQHFASINQQKPIKTGNSSFDMAMALYGKQPPSIPGGGSSHYTPGLQDYTQSIADAYLLNQKLNAGGGSAGGATQVPIPTPSPYSGYMRGYEL